jgi:hypothetical protein
MSEVALVDDFRQAIQARHRRRAIQGSILTLGALLMFSAGMLLERLAG